MTAKSSDWRPGPSVCRCCFAEGCYKDISTEYFWMGKREVYQEMLSTTFDVSISYAQSGGPNSNSRLICEPCIARLRDASDFKRQVQECERVFHQHLDPTSSVSELEAVVVEPPGKEVKLERVKVESKLSDDEDFDDHAFVDDDDDDLDDQPLTALATKVPKKESVDLMDLLDNAKPEKRKAAAKPKTPPAKKAKKKESPKPSASKPAPKPVEKKRKGSVELKLKWKPKLKYNDHRDNAAIIIECSNVCPFRWKRGAFICGYCPQTFTDFVELRNHTFEHPNRIEAMRHARASDHVKVEASDLKCEICQGPFKDIESLKDHLITFHDKPISLQQGLGLTPFIINSEEYCCTLCEERFELFNKLNSHMNGHYPNNICCQCGKAFSAAHRLKAHLATHDSQDQFKCPRCPEMFTTKIQKNNHVSSFHGQKNRYRCPVCEETLKSYADRVKHLKDNHGRKVEYACHLCTAVFAMCNQRTKHIERVHVKLKKFSCDWCQYQTVTSNNLKRHMVVHVGDRKFECSVCKKAFARAKTLKEHLRIHNNDKRFSCEFCSYACVQKCSLKSHLKTHHSHLLQANIVNLTGVEALLKERRDLSQSVPEERAERS
ncbi:zinc finger protein 846-like isoform X5 [Pectinophora gossypiella]|uniref:zinc finger protein 846-like isoform X5 n=1 Tax=Pectinophora gossypiella TaxID=13191 RepID=UPI00214F5C3D|nr:zinc finger protein 846-like isoform X5 [Pectinophora gossypiella]